MRRTNPSSAVSRSQLSESALLALDRAHRNGGYLAAGHAVHAGRVERTSAATLRGLTNRGLATMVDTPGVEGAIAIRLTQAGTKLARTR